MEHFVDAEESYLSWLIENPSGFVVNSRRKPTPDYLVLHKSKCSMISSPNIQNYTTTSYVKFCSNSLNELKDLARKMGGSLKKCKICNP